MKTQDAPTAGDILKPNIHTVTPEMQLSDVVTFLLRHKISNAPVVKQNGRHRELLGFISEADCLEYLSNELFYGNPSPPQTAATIMKKHPVCVCPEADLFALTSIFISHGYRHLPVLDDYDLLGIVSRRDVLKSLDQYYREWSRTRDREKFPVDLHKIMNHRFLVSH